MIVEADRMYFFTKVESLETFIYLSSDDKKSHYHHSIGLWIVTTIQRDQ